MSPPNIKRNDLTASMDSCICPAGTDHRDELIGNCLNRRLELALYRALAPSLALKAMKIRAVVLDRSPVSLCLRQPSPELTPTTPSRRYHRAVDQV